MKLFEQRLKEHAANEGRKVHTVRFNPTDAFTKASIFKKHRDYVEHLFNEAGYEVIQHHHMYETDTKLKKCGLIYSLTDSVIQPMVEVHGIVGISIREKSAAGN